jgi:uncharacterized membrane protein YccF (DUF307 family)
MYSGFLSEEYGMPNSFVFRVIAIITIIGIPFGMQHFKLATLALTPSGKISFSIKTP